MADLPRLLVLKGEAGVPVKRLCDSLSQVARLVLVNVQPPNPHMGATHEEAKATLAGRGEFIPVRSYEAHAEIVDAVANDPVDGILTTSEYCLILAADVAADLGLRHAEPHVTRTVRDKFAQRNALSNAGIPCPAYARIASAMDLEAASPARLTPGSPRRWISRRHPRR